MSVNVRVSGNRPWPVLCVYRNLTWTFAVTELNIRNSVEPSFGPVRARGGRTPTDMRVYRTVLGRLTADAVRYGGRAQAASHLLRFQPIRNVVLERDQELQLKCVHCTPCQDRSFGRFRPRGKRFWTTLPRSARGRLFSGGEPLVRPDLTELAEYAVGKGMRAVISTNGTLITSRIAGKLKKIGLSYVGISLDGMEEVNDRFRGVKGAFKKAMAGIMACQDVGIKVGLRFTMNR